MWVVCFVVVVIGCTSVKTPIAQKGEVTPVSDYNRIAQRTVEYALGSLMRVPSEYQMVLDDPVLTKKLIEHVTSPEHSFREKSVDLLKLRKEHLDLDRIATSHNSKVVFTTQILYDTIQLNPFREIRVPNGQALAIRLSSPIYSTTGKVYISADWRRSPSSGEGLSRVFAVSSEGEIAFEKEFLRYIE